MRALGVIALALQDPAGPVRSSVDIVSLILHADPIVQAVMVILLLFSAASWGIVFYKYRHLGRASRQNAAFIGVFRLHRADMTGWWGVGEYVGRRIGGQTMTALTNP